MTRERPSGITEKEHRDGWAPLKKGYQPAKEGTGGTNPPQGEPKNPPSPPAQSGDKKKD